MENVFPIPRRDQLSFSSAMVCFNMHTPWTYHVCPFCWLLGTATCTELQYHVLWTLFFKNFPLGHTFPLFPPPLRPPCTQRCPH